jgi:T5SS/PEP-CTERM-associated repeat protein
MKNRFYSSTFSACLCILLAAAFSASAQTVWTDATGDWFTAGNWSAGVPTAGTQAQINNGGTAQIAAGGAASDDLTLGVNGLQTGNVTISGAGNLTTSGALTVGNSGIGSVSITTGGDLTTAVATVGRNAGSSGTVTVNGTGSTWINNSGFLFLGFDGNATLNIQAGGSVVTSGNGMSVGLNSTSTSSVTVDGAGSLLNVSGLGGNLDIGSQGAHGTMTVTAGGKVLSQNGSIGRLGGGVGMVTIDGVGSSWSMNQFGIGGNGAGTTGTLIVRNGGAVTSVFSGIGGVGGVGTATITGTGSSWSSGQLTVGSGGTGTLNITSGGTVTSNASPARIGEQANSTGTVTVDGTGSTWTLAGELDVARGGTGTLTITNAGVVNMTGSGRASIGVAAGSNGTASVDGAGSMWTLGGANLNVGEDGTGGLTISNGGLVRDNDGTLGKNTNATGTVTVDGTGSTWTNLGSVRVGDLGNGTLNILHGGTVTAIDTLIAQQAGSTGLAVVDGTGGASTLQLSGNLFVGGDNGAPGGNGVLRVLNGGIVNSNRLIVLSTGTLEIGANPLITVTNPLGIEYDGGKLKTIANVTFSNNGSLQAGGIILDSNGFTSTLSGVYSGFGGLNKVNPGTMVLTNTNTYLGATNINGGSLIVDGSITSTTFVNSGGLLGGTGTVFGTVFNSGVVSPGHSPGTLNIANSYVQNADGTLRIEIGGLAPPQHDLLTVGGAATLDGTLQILRLNNFTPAVGDRVTIITDAAGHIGTFDNVTGDFFGVLRPVPQYDEANDVYVIFQLGSFNVGGLTPNQQAVANNLDDAANDPAAAALIGFLVGLPLGNLPQAFDLIAPEELAAMYEVGFSQAMVQNNNLERRMDDIRAGANGFCANVFVAPSGKDVDGGKTVLPAKDGPEVYVPIENNRWGVFGNGSGNFVNVGDDDFNAPGYEITSGNFTFGADYRVGDHFAIGVNGGYATSEADLVNGGNIDVDGGKAGIYATVFGKGFFGGKIYIDGAIGGGLNSYDTLRIGLQNELVRGDTDGSEFNGMISYGSDWTFGCFNIGTWSTIQYTRVNIDEFTEIGSLAPLEIQDQSEDSLRSTSGIRASYDIKAGRAIFRPEIRAAWQHEHGDRGYQVDSRLASGAGGIFRVHGPEVGRDAALVGAGFNLQWNNRVSTYVYYDGVLGRGNYDNNAISGGLRIGF